MPIKYTAAAIVLCLALLTPFTLWKLHKMCVIRGWLPGATTTHHTVTKKTRGRGRHGFYFYYLCWGSSEVYEFSGERVQVDADHYDQVPIGSEIEVVHYPGDPATYTRSDIYTSNGNFIFDGVLLVLELCGVGVAIALLRLIYRASRPRPAPPQRVAPAPRPGAPPRAAAQPVESRPPPLPPRPAPDGRRDAHGIPLALRRALAANTPTAFYRLQDNDLVCFQVDWRNDDADTVKDCAALLPDLPPGALTAAWVPTTDPAAINPDLVITYCGAAYQVPLRHSFDDRHLTLLALNAILAPDYEIRDVASSHDGDTRCYIVLSAGAWTYLAAEYPAALAQQLWPLEDHPFLSTDASART